MMATHSAHWRPEVLVTRRVASAVGSPPYPTGTPDLQRTRRMMKKKTRTISFYFLMLIRSCAAASFGCR